MNGRRRIPPTQPWPAGTTDDAEAIIVNALNGEGGLAGYREVLTLTDAAAMLDAE